MTVTITDVRIHLNNISPEEVSDDTVQQKIDDAEFMSNTFGIPAGALRDRFVRAWAAWRSFLISHSYNRTKIGVIDVREDLEMKAAALQKDAEDTLIDATGDMSAVLSTPMFDDRPIDPYEAGEDPETVDQTKL